MPLNTVEELCQFFGFEKMMTDLIDWVRRHESPSQSYVKEAGDGLAEVLKKYKARHDW